MSVSKEKGIASFSVDGLCVFSIPLSVNPLKQSR